jgi:hypothetical protein
VLEWPAADGTGGFPPVGGELRIGAPDRLPMRLELKANLSTAEADLRTLRSERSTFEVMGSSIRVIASEQGQPQRIRVRGMLSNVRLRLPANAPVRVVYSSWFGLRSMPQDFIEHLTGRSRDLRRRDQIFVSEGRGSSILIEIDGPFLRVVIDRAPVKEVERAMAPPAAAHATLAVAGPLG